MDFFRVDAKRCVAPFIVGGTVEADVVGIQFGVTETSRLIFQMI